MKVINSTVWHTYIMEIEHENKTYSVSMREDIDGWNINIVNCDDLEDVEADEPIWAQLVDVAEQQIYINHGRMVMYNTPDSHHCDDLDCNCSI